MVFASNKSFGGSGKLETWPIYTSHKILIGAPADPGQPRRAALKGAELAWRGLVALPGSGGTGTPGPAAWEGARGWRIGREKGKPRKRQRGGGMWAAWGGLGLVPGGSVPGGCGSPGRLLLGKLRQGAGSPRGAGCTALPTAAPRAQGLSPRPGRAWPLLAWGGPQRCRYLKGGGGGHPTLQLLQLLPATAATPAPRPRRHHDHAGTATTPAPRSRSPPPPLGILQAFNCRKHRLIKQR